MSERELTPDEEAEISRLLADAASPEPMPAEVSARLDEVLAGLVTDREAAAPVVPLKSRRWPQVLVAAAAVSLAGFVGANFIEQRSLGGADMSTASPEAAGGEEGSYDNGASRGTDGSDGTDGTEAGEPSIVVPQDGVAPPGPTPDLTAGQRLSSLKSLSQLLSRSTMDLYQPDSAFAAARCTRPQRQAYAYEVDLASARRAVVMVQRVNASAAKVYVYPCGQSVVPVAASLLLGIR